MWEDEYDLEEVTEEQLREQFVAKEEEEKGWETVGATQEAPQVEVKRPPRWCRDGNTCKWKNCVFRHEKCSFGARCRNHANDKGNTKTPEQGGCPYDHRNPVGLVNIVPIVITDEGKLWEVFGPLGLEMRMPGLFDTEDMCTNSRAVLYGSLEKTLAAGIVGDLCLPERGARIFQAGPWPMPVEPEVSEEELAREQASWDAWAERQHQANLKARDAGLLEYYCATTDEEYAAEVVIHAQWRARDAEKVQVVKEEVRKVRDAVVADAFSAWRTGEVQQVVRPNAFASMAGGAPQPNRFTALSGNGSVWKKRP